VCRQQRRGGRRRCLHPREFACRCVSVCVHACFFFQPLSGGRVAKTFGISRTRCLSDCMWCGHDRRRRRHDRVFGAGRAMWTQHLNNRTRRRHNSMCCWYDHAMRTRLCAQCWNGDARRQHDRPAKSKQTGRDI
jgi:hypothetical protein